MGFYNNVLTAEIVFGLDVCLEFRHFLLLFNHFQIMTPDIDFSIFAHFVTAINSPGSTLSGA